MLASSLPSRDRAVEVHCRDFLAALCQAMEASSPPDRASASQQQSLRMAWLAAHFTVALEASKEAGRTEQAASQALALLRCQPMLPLDRCAQLTHAVDHMRAALAPPQINKTKGIYIYILFLTIAYTLRNCCHVGSFRHAVGPRLLYEAGTAARTAQQPATALLLLNLYLDVAEAIDERNPSALSDTSPFSNCDAPWQAQLPAEHYAPQEVQEAVRR